MNIGGMYIPNIERAIFKDKEEAGVGLIIRVAEGLLIAVMSKRSLCMNPTKLRWLLLTADRVLSFANYQIYEGTYDLFASGKIINSIQLMPRYIWSVFSLPFVYIIYFELYLYIVSVSCSQRAYLHKQNFWVHVKLCMWTPDICSYVTKTMYRFSTVGLMNCSFTIFDMKVILCV